MKWFLSVSICLLISGCGGTGVPTASVSGKVTFNGNPVPEGSVVFTSTGDGYTVQANIDSNGNYTARSHDGGLPLGEYQVTVIPPTHMVSPVPGTAPEEVPKEVDNIPAKYRNSGTSELKIDVKKGSQTFDIPMTE